MNSCIGFWRNRLVIITTILLSTVMCCFYSGAHASDIKPPNIILVMADDLGYGELGAYGQKKIKTPHLDRLAEQGMKFTNHYTSAPVCAPARCSLMTGKHGGQAYVRNNFEIGTWDSFRGQIPLPEKTPTIASVLKSNGYRTGAFGKWGLGETGSSGDPLNSGFDRFFGYNCQRHAHNYYPRYLVDDAGKRALPGNDRGLTGKTYAPQVIADELLKFMENDEDPNKPFFIYYPSVIPHLALQVPKEDLEPYLGEWSETPYTGKSYLPHPTPRAAYAAMISFLDHQIGRIMDSLKKSGDLDNTLILFTSDNGATYLKGQVDYDFFNSVGAFRGLKGEIYEGGIRIPLIAYWKGHIKAGSTSHHICAHYDIMETLLSAAQISPSDRPENSGLSFLPALLSNGKQSKNHDALIWDFAGYGGQLAIRKGKWKLLQRNVRKNPKAPLELYNLKKDPEESNNLAETRSKKVQELYQMLIQSREKPLVERFEFGPYGN